MADLNFNSAFQLPERLAFWDAHPLIGDIPIVLPCTHAPFTMYVDNDDTVVKTLYWAGFFAGWEPASLRLWAGLAKSARYILDIGAYTGIYGLLAATSNQTARVDCFEASPKNYERLARNVALNKLSERMRAIHAIVTDTEGDGTLYETYSAPNILSSVHSISKQRGTPVAVRSVEIDKFISNTPDVDLIKIDVEGAEPQVLKGMSRLLADRQPVILLEANSLSELSRSWGVLPSSYQCFSIDEHGCAVAPLQIPAKSDKSAGRNYLFSARHSAQELGTFLS